MSARPHGNSSLPQDTEHGRLWSTKLVGYVPRAQPRVVEITDVLPVGARQSLTEQLRGNDVFEGATGRVRQAGAGVGVQFG